MSTWRTALLSLVLVSVSAPVIAGPAQPYTEKRNVNAAQNGVAERNQRPEIKPLEPAKVAFANGFKPRTVVIDTAARKLYFTLSSSEAYVYPVAVGKPGFAWAGTETVQRIADWPDWVPPAEMRQRKPSLPERMPGSMNNPLGAKAIYLGNTLYRIHGTNVPGSIGTAASSGCIRMLNGHVVHLAGLLKRGTKVVVMEQLPEGVTVMPPVMKSAALIEVKKPESSAAQMQIASR